MPLHKRQVSDNRHQFRGEKRGDRLAEWLNAGVGKDRQRIIGLIEDLQSITSYTLILHQAGKYLDDEKLEQLEERINKRLSFYKGGVPALSAVDETGRGIFRLWIQSTSKLRLDEWEALDLTTALSKQGLIDSVRICEQCEKWFFARFSHQHFCPGGKCRTKHYRSSESFKADRREYARENYRLKRDGKVRSWKLRER
jgi:hypothetical protein